MELIESCRDTRWEEACEEEEMYGDGRKEKKKEKGKGKLLGEAEGWEGLGRSGKVGKAGGQ